MSKGARQRFLWVGLAAAVSLAALTLAPRAGAQETKMRLGVPANDVRVGDAPFKVDVVVEDVANLGAFQFTLLYDSSVLEFVGVDQGPFLASSGRQVHCMDPRIDPGSIRYVCVTLGARPPGADGSGVLASITLAPNTQGTSALQLEDAVLASPDGQAMSAASEDSSVTIAMPGAPETPSPTGAPPTAGQVTPAATAPSGPTPTQATATKTTYVRPTPTVGGTPATTDASGGGMNWPLWGSVIGGAAVLLAATAGLFWWSRVRRRA